MEDKLLTTSAAGALLARLKGRPTPYKASTVRCWLREGGLMDAGGDGDRLAIRESDLIDWAKGAGYLPEDFQNGNESMKNPAPAAIPVRKPLPGTVVPADADDDISDSDDMDLEDETEEEDSDTEMVPCPECGELVSVSPDAVVVECPSCGERLEVVQDDGSDDDVDADSDEVDEDPDSEDSDEDDNAEDEEDQDEADEEEPEPKPARSRNPFRAFLPFLLV